MFTYEPDALMLFDRVLYGQLVTSVRAMPHMAPARHVVDKDSILLRIHSGIGLHRACHGSVVAYCADNLSINDTSLWSVQCTGTAAIIEPTDSQLKLFGAGPSRVDGGPPDPVYLRVSPQFVTVHTADYA